MATTRDWADAYLAQARADLDGARLVGAAQPSVFAMLMQMVFEKLAKAALLRSGAISLDWAVTSHRAASRMVAVMRLQRGLMAPMGGPSSGMMSSGRSKPSSTHTLPGRARCGAPERGYDLRMQKARVTVTVGRDVLAKAERQVRRGRAKSVSAWVDAAMEEKARREDLASLLVEMKAENGAPTAKEEAWARAVLGL